MWILSVYFVLGLFWGGGETILTNDSPKPASTNGSANELASQESNQRSTVYGDYYPEDYHNSAGHYGYGYEHHGSYHPHPYHNDHHHESHYDVGLKTLLIPLAGVALLGAAALLASNPVLLQLGVVSGKRRRRSVSVDGWPMEEQRFQDILLLEKFISQLPKEEVVRQERRLLASHLQCSDTLCVDRLACELHSSKTLRNKTEERHLIDMVISEIINNEFITKEYKNNVIRARKIGQSGGDCKAFLCSELENRTKNVNK